MRKDLLLRSADILQAIGAPDGFTPRELHAWMDSRPHHLPRPLYRGMKYTQVQALINKLHRLGALERRKAKDTRSYNHSRPWTYYFKEGDKVKVWIRARKEELEAVKSGENPLLFRQVSDVIVSDGKRTLHTVPTDIFRVGFMERDIMRDHDPPEGWDPDLPIYAWKLSPTTLWEQGGYKDMAQALPEPQPIDTMELPEDLMAEIVRKSRALEGVAMDPRVVIIPADRWPKPGLRPIALLGMEVVISERAQHITVAGVPKGVKL